jgi:negative regulator of flagellin synthesis FlgM
MFRGRSGVLPGETEVMQIHGTSQVHGAQPINAPHTSRAAAPNTAPSAGGIGDRLDISEAGEIAGRMAEIPEIRADRVRDIRAAIQNGSYETEAKLSTALERLLDEIA